MPAKTSSSKIALNLSSRSRGEESFTISDDRQIGSPRSSSTVI
jgi:hypothetical protein